MKEKTYSINSDGDWNMYTYQDLKNDINHLKKYLFNIITACNKQTARPKQAGLKCLS